MLACSRILKTRFSGQLTSCVLKRSLHYGPTRILTSTTFERFRNNQQPLLRQSQSGHLAYRFYAKQPFDNSSSSNNNDDPNRAADEEFWYSDEDGEFDESEDEEDERSDIALPSSVPLQFPVVPMIAVKYPIFPKFSKILEVTDRNLIKSLEMMVELRTPYAGVFVLKDPESESTMVTNVDQVHRVGTFIKIGEMEKRGDKLNLIATGHRRIKLIRQLEATTPQATTPKAKTSSANRDAILAKLEACVVKQDEKLKDETEQTDGAKKKKAAKELKDEKERKNAKEETDEKNAKSNSVILVETENMRSSGVDKQSTEYKAITLEMVSTIREIISENPFIQEAVKQMLGENLNVAENPAYLADLAAAITSARPEELQQIIEEEDVSNIILLLANVIVPFGK